MFWVVARRLLGCSGWLLGCARRLLGCSGGFLGRLLAVARVFWVVSRQLLGCFRAVPGWYVWLLWCY